MWSFVDGGFVAHLMHEQISMVTSIRWEASIIQKMSAHRCPAMFLQIWFPQNSYSKLLMLNFTYAPFLRMMRFLPEIWT